MNRQVVVPAVLVFASLLTSTGASGQTQTWNDPQNMRPQDGRTAGIQDGIVPGFVVIKLKLSATETGIPAVQSAEPALAALSRYGVTSLARAFPRVARLSDGDIAAGRTDLSRIYHATISSSMNPVEVAARIAKLPEVEYAEPRYYYVPCDIPNDSDYVSMQQVYFERMKVPEAWAIQKGSPEVVIATVDIGTDWQHPDLLANIRVNPGEDLNHDGVFQLSELNGVDDDHNGYVDDIIGWNFANNTYDPRGADHGTKTASVFGAVTNNNRGMAGTSWNCRILPVCAAHPVYFDKIFWGPEGIEYAAAMGANVINCSWGQDRYPDSVSHELQDAINYATEAGALVVAAAGNAPQQNNDITPFYPASYDNVLSVGATADTSDALAYFSHYGLNVSTFAPGMRIRVALNNNSYNIEQGTSLSAPIVTGLAGLLKSAHPTWTPGQIAMQIRLTSDPIDGSNPPYLAGTLGHGRVNFYHALSEDHAGIVFIGGRFHKPTDTTTLFMTADTVLLSLKVKNVMPRAAENLSFSVMPDPGLAPLPPIAGPARLDAGAEDSIQVALRVDDRARGAEVPVRLRWDANTGDWDARFYKTTAYARTGIWKRQTSPIAFRIISIHAVSSAVAWAAGTGYAMERGVLRTIDGGENWSSLNSLPADFYPACIFGIDSRRAWMGGGLMGQGGTIFATANGGMSWTRQAYPAPRVEFVFRGLWFADSAYGFALGDPSLAGRIVLLRTTDGGVTWNHLAYEPTSVEFTSASLICGTDRQHIWFGGADSLVHRTTDGGETWSSAKVGAGPILSLAMHDNSAGIACSAPAYLNGPATYARTTDGGASWQALSDVKPLSGWGASFPAERLAWFTGGPYVAHSSDAGLTWVLEPTDPLKGNVIAVSFSDSAHGWAATDSGEILRYRPLLTSVRFETGWNLPVQALLHQNYPNPFNPATTIRFELSKSSEVRLSVYDILGREVTVLVNERKHAGVHQASFDGTRFASGVYFYRLTTEGSSQTRKLLLLR